MTRDELRGLIAEIQRVGAELDDVEAKRAAGGMPQRLFESLSAFANRPGGGVVLLGLDETRGFRPVGVGDAQRLQERISSLASDGMEPQLRPRYCVDVIDRATVVAVEIDEMVHELKPCYYKRAGQTSGSYIRVGNSNRRMSEYEIFGYVSARTQPTFDEGPVLEATQSDLDSGRLDLYLQQLSRVRPDAGFLSQPREEALKQLHVIREVDGVAHPTRAGLLVFGSNPQLFEPQLVITFVQYYGTTEDEPGPHDERFLDNRKFEGPIPDMIRRAVGHVMAAIKKSSIVDGLFRRDLPEYPMEAIREAVVNAIAHRDYSNYARGSYVQIRLFADRLEVQSPGGLFGPVTVDNIEEEQSTRNRTLMRMMEDMQLVENRGSGVRAMIGAMRRANLEPPRFEDKRSSFWVRFHSHTLMGPEAVNWLKQFADKTLNDQQRLALVYLKNNTSMANSDYRRLNRVDTPTATQHLRGLVETGLVRQHGTRRGAYYTLRDDLAGKQSRTDDHRVIEYVRQHGSISNEESRELLGVKANQAWYVLKRLVDKGLLRKKGSRRWTRYVLSEPPAR